MTIAVEDGSLVAGANSYASSDDADAYFENKGSTVWISSVSDDLKETALIRASQAIDTKYAGAFPGYRKAGREQSMEWPRAVAYDRQGWLIRDDQVPVEVIYATFEAAVRELVTPGSMSPDLSTNNYVRSVKAGSVSVQYDANAPAQTRFQIIDRILSGILSAGGGGGLFGEASRV